MAIQNNQKVNKPLILSVSIFGALMAITTLSCALAMNADSASAESASASVNVSAACTFESNTDSAHTATIDPGTWKEDIGQTSFTAKCNDPGGFSIYAVGYSNDEWKNTNLIGPNSNVIATNTNKNGNTSGWSMKLANGTGDTTTILSPYNDYAIVPGGSVEDPGDQTGGYAKVATYNATTAGTSGSSLIATYGAYVADKQAAGMYNGEVKYTLIHPSDAIPQDKYYMQDFTLEMCEVLANSQNITVYDRRDESDYTVRYINGACWMTQNLRITGIISAANSNFTGDDFNVSEYDLKDDGESECYGVTGSSSGSGYKNTCSHIPDSTDVGAIGSNINIKTIGAWYNYKAVTAGTIGVAGSDPVVSDICPANWHLPSGSSATMGADYNKLVGNTTSGWQSPTPGLIAFGTVYGGRYVNGSLGQATRGFWWSTKNIGSVYRFSLGYNSEDGQFTGNSPAARHYGLFVRCVRTD